MKQLFKKYEHTFFSFLLVILDITGISAAFLAAYAIRFHTIFPVPKGIPPFVEYVKILGPLVVLFVLVFERMGIYKPKIDPFHIGEITELLKGVVIGSMMVMSASFLYRNFEFSRGVFVITFTVMPIILGLEKIMVRTLQVSLRRHGLLLRNVLIVGCGENAWKYFEVISSKLSLGFRPVGFLSVKEEGISEKFPYTKNILGTTHEIARIIRKFAVDEVMIALPSSIHSRVLDIITQCEREIVKFNVMPDMFEIMISKVTIQEIEGMPFVTLTEPKLLTWWYFIKRVFDVIGAVSGLVIFAPCLIVIAICIKLDSKGPVLYLQKRVGIDGKKFFMFKFRTMRIDAEQHTGPVWANKEDDRRTRIGTFLRKTNLDELPQLFNVLRSDMSLVGPRPERPFFVNKFKHNIPHYMSRHRVKSGITGWAQVNGLRGNTSLEERVKYDLFYIENWSFMFDIKILLMTFFSHKNAY